jgi:hypothetical protein
MNNKNSVKLFKDKNTNFVGKNKVLSMIFLKNYLYY